MTAMSDNAQFKSVLDLLYEKTKLIPYRPGELYEAVFVVRQVRHYGLVGTHVEIIKNDFESPSEQWEEDAASESPDA